MSPGASLQTPLGELTALPKPSSWFQGGRFVAGGEWRGGERRTRGREGRGERREKGEWGREGKRGKLSWGSALVVEGIDAPA